MGQDHSSQALSPDASIEQMSQSLARQFAQQCFTPLEILHLKDIFKTLVESQDDVQYWRESSLSEFLVLPAFIGTGSTGSGSGPGPLIYQMATYLGAFPFSTTQSPCILTLEALVKVIVIMTERCGQVIKGGRTARDRLLFKSLAIAERPRASKSDKEPKSETDCGDDHSDQNSNSNGPIVDEAPDKERMDLDSHEDTKELTLQALNELDAISIFEYDERRGSKSSTTSTIPVDNFRQLLMLLLATAPLIPTQPLVNYAAGALQGRYERLRETADCILWSFDPENHAGISYSTFTSVVPNSMPYLFDGLAPLFEHFLFSANLGFEQQGSPNGKISSPDFETRQPSKFAAVGDILDFETRSQLALVFEKEIVFNRLRLLYSGADAGFSMRSIEHKVFTWKAPTILVVAGTRISDSTDHVGPARSFAQRLPLKRFSDGTRGNRSDEKVIFAAYVDKPWQQTHKQALGGADCLLMQLSPRHEVFRASATNNNYLTFTDLGIGFGSPPPKKQHVSSSTAVTMDLGPVSLYLDENLEYGVFTHDSAGGGSYMPSQTRPSNWQDRFEIDSLEIWGCGGEAEAECQRSAQEFEAREAAARTGLKRSQDIESDRALLEMAGLVGNHNASGGSMG